MHILLLPIYYHAEHLGIFGDLVICYADVLESDGFFILFCAILLSITFYRDYWCQIFATMYFYGSTARPVRLLLQLYSTYVYRGIHLILSPLYTMFGRAYQKWWI